MLGLTFIAQYYTLISLSFPHLNRVKFRLTNKGRCDILPCMRNYELTLLLKASVDESSLQGLLGEIASMLQDEGALIITQDIKGKRALLAPVKKHSEAQLAVIKFTMDPQKIESMDTNLKNKESILRFALLTYTPQKAKERLIAKPVATPAIAKEEPAEVEKVEIGDIDKKLEEIFKDEV